VRIRIGRKKLSSNRARGRSPSRGRGGAREGEVGREAKSEGSTTSLGRIYTPSLSSNSSETDLDADSLRTDLTDSNPNSLSS